MPESAVTVSPVSAPELEALRVSEARLRALFEQAPVGVAEVDRNTGRFLSVNRRFSEMLGYSAD